MLKALILTIKTGCRVAALDYALVCEVPFISLLEGTGVCGHVSLGLLFLGLQQSYLEFSKWGWA